MGLQDRVAAIVGEPVTLNPIPGGLTTAACFVASTASGRSYFVKLGARSSVGDVQIEGRFLSEVSAPILPTFFGLDSGTGAPLLVCEDLTGASWTAPVDAASATGLLPEISRIARLPAPGWLPLASTAPPDAWAGLENRGDLARPLGLDPGEWAAIVRSLQAQQLRRWQRDGVVHGDLGPGNWCLADRGWVFADWASVRVADHRLDVVTALLRLRVKGIAVDYDVAELPLVVALMAGFLVRELTSDQLPVGARASKIADTGTAVRWAMELGG